MKHFFLFIISIFCILFFTVSPVFAIEDPLSLPNNKFGIHILFPSELQKAAQLVNSSGGDWGYVVIPIQSGDKDLAKWQAFMNDCAKYHLIPIIRLATEGDYFNTQVWRKPNDLDILDFVNFLNSLDWPTKNRYIIVYNEVNRGDEWGGTPNPSEYANVLSYAVTVFKIKNPDFFIISAGMDNAAANTVFSLDEYTYFYQMDQAVPGIFNQIDGMGSHSYPNPAFSQPPWVNTRMSINSFQYEKALLNSLSNKSLPVFITETGWSMDSVGEQTAAFYVTQAFSGAWSDPSIVTVSPFLLQAGTEPFSTFSFLSPSGDNNAVYKAYAALQKVKGTPTINQQVLAAATITSSHAMPTEKFTKATLLASVIQVPQDVKYLFKWLLHVPLQ